MIVWLKDHIVGPDAIVVLNADELSATVFNHLSNLTWVDHHGTSVQQSYSEVHGTIVQKV